MSARTNFPSWFAWLLMVAALFMASAKSYAAPAITSLSPSSAVAGGPAFTLTVNGSGFGGLAITATVRWNGAARQTTLVSSNQLTAAITAADIANAGTAQVTVRNQGALDDETSAPVTFTINNPAPVISSLSPTSVLAGGSDFTLTVNGFNFVEDSRVRLNNSNQNTTFVRSSQLTARIEDNDIRQPGALSITVVNPSPGGGTSNAMALNVTGALTITTGSSLPPAVAGSPYSQTLAASGGAPPYTWSVSAGTLPAGLALNASSGTIGGTPSAVRDSTFTVRVSDSGSTSATKQFQLSVSSSAAANFTISGVSDTVEPAQQPSLEITLASAHSSPISGQLTLKFTSNADVASDDPSIQFSTGGRVVSFSIPADRTRAVFSNGASNIAFQTGTVSGTLELTVSGQSGGSRGTPLPPASRTLTLTRRAPAITRLNIAARSASSFELAITGFSTPRSLTQATFRFTAAQGANLEASTVTLNLATPATSWFRSQTGASLGGQFRVLMPFTVQGEVTAIQSVSVTLANGEGTSAASSVQF